MTRSNKLLLILTVAAFAAFSGSAQAATINVTTTAEDYGDNLGNCSLREAVRAANTNGLFGGCPAGTSDASGTDVIVLGAGTFVLVGASGDASGLDDEAEPPYQGPTGGPNKSGDLDSAGTLVIRGAGAGATTIDSNPGTRVIESTALTLQDMTLDGGSVLSEGTGAGNGGVVKASGALQLDGVVVKNGTAFGGGGIYSNSAAGAIVNDSVISDNTSSPGGGAVNNGGGMLVTGGPLQLVRSSVANNDTAGAGGSIYEGGGVELDAEGTSSIVDSLFSGNTVTNAGTIGSVFGGGLHYSGGTVNISRTLFSGNTTHAAGAGYLEDGGGIYAASGTVNVTNSTFYGNVAGTDTGNDSGTGGAILGGDAAIAVAFSTFSGNTAQFGDSLAQQGGTLQIAGSVLPGNASSACSGTITSGGYNVLDGTDCVSGATDKTNAALGLAGAPAANGGYTNTIALTAGSDAIDFVPTAQCGLAGGGDQRGYPRPAGAACDAGAFESGAVPPAAGISISPTSKNYGTLLIGQSSPQTFTITNTGTSSLSVSTAEIVAGPDASQFAVTDNQCLSSVSPGGTCTIDVSFSPTVVGAKSATFRLTDNAAGSPHDVALTGNATTSGSGPGALVTPASVAFGSQQVGAGPSAPRGVTVTNTGGSSLTVSSVSIAGANPAEFTITSNTCLAVAIAPAGNCSVGVAFVPASAGAKSAQLQIVDNAAGSPHSADLSGTGTSPASTPGNEFTVGAVKARKVTVTVPGPGAIAIKDVSTARKKMLLAPSSATAGGAGPVQVSLKLTKKAATRLRTTGTVKLNASITFTPAGGAANTKSAKLKVKGKRPRPRARALSWGWS